jgi:DNA-directed RNA polymerase subunit F
MAQFDFYLDQKHTIWYRNKFTIDAETLEEAKDKVIKLSEIAADCLPSDEWEILYDTNEVMTVKENDGQPTVELYTNDGDLIYENA